MAHSRQALGKGIGALIPSATSRRAPTTFAARPAAGDGDAVQAIPLEAIDPNPRQPRVRFAEADLQELTTSIEERGVLQPILVRPLAQGRYELVAGERRLRASQRAGRSHIPAIVKQMNDDESLLAAIIENVQRADLNPMEEAQGYQRLQSDFGMTQEEIAQRVGKSRPTVANALRLLQLPSKTQEEIRAGRLSAGHARAILAIEDTAAREALTRKILDRGLSVREAEKAARQTKKPSHGAATKSDPDVALMEADLSRALGTKVTISTARAGGGRGRVELNFYSNDDLARLVGLLLSTAHAARARATGG